jgi:hypothetical protein
VNVDDARNYVRSIGELPIATVSEDTFTESPEDTNGVEEIHRDIVAAELIISDHSDKCSQDLKNESSIDSSNIPQDAHPYQCDKSNYTHSQTSIPATEHEHIPLEHDSEEPSIYSITSSAKECGEVVCNTPKQQHEFNKEFYILTAASDEDDENKERWQQGEMTQWSHTDNDAKGRAAVVQEGTNDSVAVPKEFALYQGLSGIDSSCHSGGKSAALMNEKLCVLKTFTSENQSGVGCTMALNAKTECLRESEDSVCDKGMKGASLRAEPVSVVCDPSVVMAKHDVETPIVVPDVDEHDCSTMSVPSIVLDLPPSTEHPTSSRLSSSDSQGPQRPPKLQLHIATTCSQSPARKSPVTVQEWVDSLPIHHR